MTFTIAPRWASAPVAVFTVLLLAVWAVAAQGNTYLVYLYGVGLVYATATLGLHLLANDCGEVSLAHGGQVALGAFVGAHFFSTVSGPVSFPLLLAGSVVAGAISGALVSLPMMKLRGLAVAVVTLLLNAAIFHYLLRFPSFVGGSGGIRLRSPLLPSTDFEAVIWLTIITVGAVIVTQRLRRGRFGRGLRAMRANDQLARSVGIPVERYRIAAYTVAGAIAGLAGAMWVVLHHGIAPSAFTDASSLLLLTMALLGGRGSVVGPMTAAIAVGVLTGLFGSYGVAVSFIAPIALLVVLIKYPGGLNEQLAELAHIVRSLTSRIVGGKSNSDLSTSSAPTPADGGVELEPPLRTGEPVSSTHPDPVIRCVDVAVTFGGLRAVGGVSLAVHSGEVVALMGPNGAGKTTLLNVLTGHVRPTAGTVWLQESDVTGEVVHRRVARGLRRTFQVNGHLPNECGLEHLRLGMHLHPTRDEHIQDRAMRITHHLGLSPDELLQPLAGLPAGTARLIEIAAALATPGNVLLLDEPSVGLTQAERQRLANTLRSLASNELAVILVDHDTDFVRRVADRAVALNAGQIIAEGTPSEVFGDPAFIAAYLGTAEVSA